MLGKRLFGFQNPISKSGPGLEPLCNREAQVGAPDLDLALVPSLCVRREEKGGPNFGVTPQSEEKKKADQISQ